MIDQSLETFVRSLAERSPTPGGGAAAAVAAGLGAALFLMVVRFSRGKKANADRESDLAEAEKLLEEQVQRLLPMAERDCLAFDRVSAAYKMPKETEEEIAARKAAIEEAMVGAMAVPEEGLVLIRDVFRAMNEVVSCVGAAITSDLGSGSELLKAASEAAYLNVLVNAGSLKDRERAESATDRVEAIRREIRDIAGAFRELVDTRI